MVKEFSIYKESEWWTILYDGSPLLYWDFDRECFEVGSLSNLYKRKDECKWHFTEEEIEKIKEDYGLDGFIVVELQGQCA